MSDVRGPEQERDALAGEYALGLLEGEALAEARHRLLADRAFADAVTRWEERLVPLLDGVPAAEPPPQLWTRIQRELSDAPGDAGVVVQLRRRRNLWRGYAVAMTAIAASLALAIGLGPGGEPPPVVQPQAQPPLVASLSAEDRAAAVTVVFDRNDGTLLVTPAVLEAPAGRDHELWVVPESGAPRSLGVVRREGPRRVAVPPALAALLRERGTLALSVEPSGGSPTGAPTGPVVATGELVTA